MANTGAMDRRGFLRAGLAATGFAALGAPFWRSLASDGAPVPGASPYGAVGAADRFGIRLPPGFEARRIALSNEPVADTGYLWHWNPDGGATFADAEGGWIYACNSEVPGTGGAGAVRFDASGEIVDAYRILSNTSENCAGGATPWGTWLSCEEHPGGRVWECDPMGVRPAVPRHLLGTFKHEAAVVGGGAVYLTEDRSDGCFYRFTPVASPGEAALTLAAGTLEVAIVDDGMVTWQPVPVPYVLAIGETEYTTPTRDQVAGATRFNRGEGAFYDEAARTVYFCTTGDNTIWAYDIDASTIDRLFSSTNTPGSPLNGADNITVSPGGEIFVCEDHGASGGPLQMILIADGLVSPFLELDPAKHGGSEMTGVAFDPSGTRMYLSSQRYAGLGATYEINGPFVV